MKNLTPLEWKLLNSQDCEGLIPFPEGSPRSIERAFACLDALAVDGYVEICNRHGFRAYWITGKGRATVASFAEAAYTTEGIAVAVSG